MAFGTPGGEQQDQWSVIMFLRMVHHRMGIQQAIDAPSFHSEHWPSSFWPRVARPGRLVLFDVAEQLAHSARVRLSLQPSAPEPPLLGAAAQLAPLHALATPGPVEALALRPSLCSRGWTTSRSSERCAAAAGQ